MHVGVNLAEKFIGFLILICTTLVCMKTKINKIMFIKPGTAFEINIIIYKLRGYKSLKT